MINAPAGKSQIGVFGIGLAACRPQFPGLKERPEGYRRTVESRGAHFGAEAVSTGLVDSAPPAREAGVMLPVDMHLLTLRYCFSDHTSNQGRISR